jgi:plastocyanin
VALATLAASTLLLAGCDDGKGQSGTQPAGATTSAVVVDDVQVLETDAGNDLRFSNTSLFARTGAVKITLKVTGSIPHNLAFSDGTQASTGTVNNNKTETLQLTFTKPGTYHFLCTIHPYMKGTLTIS